MKQTEVPQSGKAVLVGPTFRHCGMWHTVSEQQTEELGRGRSLRSVFQESLPGVVEGLEAIEKKIQLPSGWRMKYDVSGDGYNRGYFVMVGFRVPHGLDFGSDIPETTAHLFSAYLQKSWKLNFENFAKCLHRADYGFLPLMINEHWYDFWIYNPTIDRIQQGIRTFTQVLKDISCKRFLERDIKQAYALVRLDESHKVARGLHTSDCGTCEVRAADLLLVYLK